MTPCKYKCDKTCRMGFNRANCQSLIKATQPTPVIAKPQGCGTCGGAKPATVDEPYLPPGKITKWCGVLWFGVPYPLRLVEYWFSATWPDRACGCTVIGKTTWNWLKHCWETFKQARAGIKATRLAYNQSAAMKR